MVFMGVEAKVKVHVEFQGAIIDFEGSAEEVFKAFTHFITQTYPSLSVVQKLVFTPDFLGIAESLKGCVELAPEGPLLIAGRELPAGEAMCLSLLGAYVGYKFDKLGKDTLSIDEITRTTGKAYKTVMNQLPWMIDEGLIERVGKGEYRITSKGIKRGQEIAGGLKTQGKAGV